MKKYFLLISLLSAFFVNYAYADCTGASPTWTCTANSTSAQIQSCINSASPGDTINVGAGSGTWSNISITKGINLIGAGIGITNITAGTCSGAGNTFMQYNPSNKSLNTPFRLSGFSFNGNGVCGGILLGSWSPALYAPFTVQSKVRIDHNRFYNNGTVSGGYDVYIWDALVAWGVVDHNTFDSNYDLPFRSNSGSDYNQGWWTTDPQSRWNPGTETGLYFENNEITITAGSSGTQFIDTNEGGGKYIFRYNLITRPDIYAELFDMHGNQTTSGGSFGAEIYGNRVVGTSSKSITLYKSRGGSGYVYNNSVVASSGVSITGFDSLVNCPPSDANPGKQMVHDTYGWGSRINYTGSVLNTAQGNHTVTCDGLSNRPLAGRDFFGPTTSPGVTAGTLASRPATCSVGQGYWATNQSTSDLTGMVGIDPSTPISGTFYKCTATNTWTAFYTPYTYPHPLTTGTPPPTFLKTPNYPVPIVN